MSQPVKGSMLSDISNFLKSISKTVFDAMDKLWNSGILVDIEKNDKGGYRSKLEIDGEPVEVDIIPTPGKDKEFQDVSIRLKNGRKVDIPSVPNKDFGRQLDKALRKEFPNSDILYGSKRLQVKLQKVTSSKHTDIKLTAITANYDPAAAVCDLDAILGDDVFISEIPDTPTCYEITDDGDEYDVDTIEEFSTSNSFDQLISMAMKIWCNMSVIHWASAGTHFNDLHTLLDECRARIMDEVDVFGELSMEFCDTVINPGVFVTDDISKIDDTGSGFTAEFGFSLVSDLIEQYVAVLDKYYVNFPHDVQSWVDEEIRYWNKTNRYFIKQRMK